MVMRASERLIIDRRMRREVYTSTHNLEMDEHLTCFTFLDSQFAGVEGHHRHWGGGRREGEEGRVDNLLNYLCMCLFTHIDYCYDKLNLPDQRGCHC